MTPLGKLCYLSPNGLPRFNSRFSMRNDGCQSFEKTWVHILDPLPGVRIVIRFAKSFPRPHQWLQGQSPLPIQRRPLLLPRAFGPGDCQSVWTKRNYKQRANLFQSTQLFDVSPFIEGLLDEFPTVLFIGADDSIRACAAGIITFPDDEHVRKIG